MGVYEVTVKRIRELCKERNITPNALSYAAGISQSTIKSILNGESVNPGIVTIKKICDGFDITIGGILQHQRVQLFGTGVGIAIRSSTFETARPMEIPRAFLFARLVG